MTKIKKSVIEKIKEDKEQVKKETVKKIKESSIKAYYSRLASLMKRLNVDIDYETNLSKHFNDIKEIVESYSNNNTKKNYYIMLNSIGDLFNFTKEQMKYFTERMDELNDNVKKQADSHELTEKESDNWLSLEEYENIMKNLKDKILKIKLIDKYPEVKSVLKYLILLFMRYFPARNNEITNCQIYIKSDMPDDVEKMDDKFNYIILDENNNEGIFYKNNYKTAGTYGPKQFDLKDIVVKELLKYYPVLIKFGNNNFLFDRDGQAISPNVLTRWLNSIFDKNISSQMIRKIIRSQGASVNLNKLMELQEEAEMMGHSLSTDIKFYMKKVPKK